MGWEGAVLFLPYLIKAILMSRKMSPFYLLIFVFFVFLYPLVNDFLCTVQLICMFCQRPIMFVGLVNKG